MFINQKAQSIVDSNRSSNQEWIYNFDTKLEQQNGPSYQQVLYTQFDKEKTCFTHYGYDMQYAKIYVIYGFMLQEEDLPNVRLHLVKILHQQVIEKKAQDRGLCIIYFNGQTKDKNQKNKKKIKSIQFKDFKQSVLKQIQFKYLKCIKGFYVCHEGFFSKTKNVFSFSKFELHNQIVDSLIKYCDSLECLVKILGPLFECQMIKQEVQQFNKTIQWIEIYTDLDKKSAKRRMIQQLGQFQNGESFYKRKISQYVVEYQTGIPIILNCLLETIQRYPYFAQSQGIFRKACDPQKLKKLQSELNGCLLEQQIVRIALKYDADTIACCIKTFFNKLNPPIVNYQIYDNLILKMKTMYQQNKQQQTKHSKDQNLQDTSSDQDEHRNQNNLHMIPTNTKIELQEDKMAELVYYTANSIQVKDKIILSRLIRFFRKTIIPNEKYNKMGPYNLSVVMGPCIFKPRKYSISDLINSPRMANLLYNLVMNPDRLEWKQ